MNETISRFEDLIAWKKARILTRKIYSVSTVGKFGKDFGLRNQIQRAAVSIMSNIAEGYERGAYGEFHHFVSIAKASCAEVRCQLYVAADVGYISADQFRELRAESEEVGRILGGLRRSIQQKRSKH
jgi:four helix bundle protein